MGQNISKLRWERVKHRTRRGQSNHPVQLATSTGGRVLEALFRAVPATRTPASSHTLPIACWQNKPLGFKYDTVCSCCPSWAPAHPPPLLNANMKKDTDIPEGMIL